MYIVYKHTSPSGHSYVGYTKLSLERRWKNKINELKNASTPLAHALRKYGTDNWEHEILYETDSKEEAEDKEIELIAIYGYYNVAKGGTGGDTGLNNNPDKIKKQAKSLSKHWHSLPEEEKERRIMASIESRRRNGTLGNNNPKFGSEHGNWSGYWVVNHKKYVTIKDAINETGLNESTIIDLCVRKTDKVYTKSSKMVQKGKTPRQCGHYKETS